MKSLFWAASVVAAALMTAGRAHAAERGGYSMEILVDGMPLREYAARGTRYIEALKGREYSIRFCNRTGERVAVALSVDGLNSIDARTTSTVDARKWVLDPYQTITLDGWQTSESTARRFYFTTESQSYGAWLGKKKNLGLVAAAVFHERRPRVYLQGSDGRPEEQKRQADGGAPPAAPAPEGALKDSASAEPGMRALPKATDDLAATGIGEETSHPVHQVAFDIEDAPSALLELRYEYRDSLVRLGVLPEEPTCPDRLLRRERARGFEPASFAPDPYRRRDF